MIGLLVVTTVLSGGAEPLSAVQIGELSVKVPSTWKASLEEGTRRYDAPSGDAYFLLDVGRTQSKMTGAVCLEKILARLEGDFRKLTIGASPAAWKRDTDKSAEGVVQTITFVGCDGRTTWSLVFHYDEKQKDRYQDLAEQIGRGVAYQKAK
ncbi:MAG: hypothetical protein HYZ28_12855 [Myxococcales bacterium]|nr:hypothetical protein [Myxococcales bacterium]